MLRLSRKVLDGLVGQDLRQVGGVAGGDLLPDLLVLDALGDQLAERLVGGRQVALGDRRLLRDGDDLLLLRELEQRLLGRLKAQLQLLDLILEEGLGVGVGLEPLVEVGGDEGVGISRDDLLGELGIGVGVADVDEAGAAQRLDGEVAS